MKLPGEWIVELRNHKTGDDWQASPSFYSWLVGQDRVSAAQMKDPEPRTLEECLDFLSEPREAAQRMHPTEGSYRIRNIKTEEIIPGDVFDLD